MLNHKKTYRLYREDGLLVRTKKRKRLSGRERLQLSVLQQRNQRWSMDFVSDSLSLLWQGHGTDVSRVGLIGHGGHGGSHGTGWL